MYVILVEQDNSLYGSKKERIMQRSKCVDNLVFVVDPIYRNMYDMTNATVMLEYIRPISRKYETEILVLSEERYNGFLQYKLPFNTKLTAEHGSLELQLTFVYTDLDEHGNGIQRVRKTSPTTIDIIPISAWSDIIPDEVLTPLDQRVIKQDAQIRALTDLAIAMNNNQVDNLVYNKTEDTLQLSANGIGIGNKVSIKDMLDDGIPVVDLNSNSSDDSNKENNNNCSCGCDCEDNVVEFGDIIAPEKPNVNNDNVVEF